MAKSKSVKTSHLDDILRRSRVLVEGADSVLDPVPIMQDRSPRANPMWVGPHGVNGHKQGITKAERMSRGEKLSAIADQCGISMGQLTTYMHSMKEGKTTFEAAKDANLDTLAARDIKISINNLGVPIEELIESRYVYDMDFDPRNPSLNMPGMHNIGAPPSKVDTKPGYGDKPINVSPSPDRVNLVGDLIKVVEDIESRSPGFISDFISVMTALEDISMASDDFVEEDEDPYFGFEESYEEESEVDDDDDDDEDGDNGEDEDDDYDDGGDDDEEGIEEAFGYDPEEYEDYQVTLSDTSLAIDVYDDPIAIEKVAKGIADALENHISGSQPGRIGVAFSTYEGPNTLNQVMIKGRDTTGRDVELYVDYNGFKFSVPSSESYAEMKHMHHAPLSNLSLILQHVGKTLIHDQYKYSEINQPKASV